MKKEYKRVFIDSAPIIYLLDNNEQYVNMVKNKIINVVKNGGRIVISPITVMEYLTVPYREKRYDSITLFHSFIDEVNIEVCDIDMKTAEKSAQIRAAYDMFKGLDSFQLACAEMNGCDSFLTNDRQLKQYKGINIDCLT